MLPIDRMISKYNNSSRGGEGIKYIVLHYTGNKGDNAKNNALYFNRANRNASAHYFVSDSQIYQIVEDNRASWAVGDGHGRYGITNSNSINVEMCCWTDGTVSEKTEANTVELIKYLMKKHNIDLSHVVRHYDASRKNCPNWSQQRWDNFKSKLTNTTTTKPSTPPPSSSVSSYTVRIDTDILNVRKSPSTNAPITAQIKKGDVYTIIEESNGWGKLKSGIGWIFLKYTVVVSKPKPEQKPSQFTVKIDTDILNVRKGPGSNNPITTQVKRGQVYTIIEESNGWGRLKSGAGWISLEYTVRC